MTTHLTFSRKNKTRKSKNKFLAALLILSMLISSIAMPESTAAEDATSDEVTVKIGFDCSGFSIQDKQGNFLFDTVNGTITWQDTERVKYISYEKYTTCGGGAPLTDFLEITGDINLVITCTLAVYFNIIIYRGTQPQYHSYSAIPGTVITISDDGIKETSPTTKLQWDKVETAERYAILLKRRDLGYVIEGGRPFANTKKTSFTISREKGKTYQIWAQKKAKGGWRTIKTIEITISDDEVNVDSRPLSKLSWKKVKNAERYAVLEKRTSSIMGGRPFDYTKKTSYKVRGEEGKTYQIRAQKKVKGKWKTIKTIDITI